MKQVLIYLGLLLAAIIVFYWLNNRYQVKNKVGTVAVDKQIYFQLPEGLVNGQEKEIKLVAKEEKGKITGYKIVFNYASEEMEILSVEVNKDIYNQGAETEIRPDIGKVTVVAQSKTGLENINNGEVILATFKVKGLKKGNTMVYATSRPIMSVWDGTKINEEYFVMPNFKINFL